jgi:hypothetical protein
MKRASLLVVTLVLSVGFGLVIPYSAAVRSQDRRQAKPAVAEEAPKYLKGSWELVECDYPRTIGYHPDRKVSPGYALLMYAYAAVNPEKNSPKQVLRWRLVETRLMVETATATDGKEERETVAQFDCVFRTRDKPAGLDLMWQPPGFDDLCKEEKGQKVLGIFRGEEKLEVVLDFSGKKRPAAFTPNESCYRLVFRRVKP